ncbi:MAG TPA: hypothetical protein PKN48_10955 [Bacteroidales bacterium]|nr:hypothetical protein [Bacteroidales bacterium]
MFKNIHTRTSLICMILLAGIAISCKTEKSCSTGCRYGNTEDIGIHKKLNTKKTVKELHRSTLTGTLTKDLDKQENMNSGKAVKKRPKKSRTINQPIL